MRKRHYLNHIKFTHSLFWRGCLELASTAALVHQSPHDLDGEREHDGGVLLGGDIRQGLEISEDCESDDVDISGEVLPELQGSRGAADYVGGVLQCLGSKLLALGLDHLSLGLSGGLGLGSHSPLQLLGQPHVLDLDPLHPDPPVVSRLVQCCQHALGDDLPVSQNILTKEDVFFILSSVCQRLRGGSWCRECS